MKPELIRMTCTAAALLLAATMQAGAQAGRPLHLRVSDPMSKMLGCECVKDYAQRDYDRLVATLSSNLNRRVEVSYGDPLPEAGSQPEVHLVIGKDSELRAYAAEQKRTLHPIARLTDTEGQTTLRGLFVVRDGDSIRSLKDLSGRRILFGSTRNAEKRQAALDSLGKAGVVVKEPLEESSSCNRAAESVLEKEADAALISSYALPLMEGCHVIDPGALRVLDKTGEVPFVTLFATEALKADARMAVRRALEVVNRDVGLLKAMESKKGFVLESASPRDQPSTRTGDWPGWRGVARDGHAAVLPPTLPADGTPPLWKAPMKGSCLSGVAVSRGVVVTADKDLERGIDYFRGLDADTGRPLWELAYAAAEEMDYTSVPRATPTIDGEVVFLLGALGDLHAVGLRDGQVKWRRHLQKDFGAERPTWGYCSSPLVVGDRLIVNPGAPDASVVALDKNSGTVLWKCPGDKAAYASFIIGAFGGREQIVGYDATTIGGWDPSTGRRLWTLKPEADDDFNVPTPLALGGRLLVATENNGTRLYEFNPDGTIRPTPAAVSMDLAPDSNSAVVAGGWIVGSGGSLVALEAGAGLRTAWRKEDTSFEGNCAIVAGPGGRLATFSENSLVQLFQLGAGRLEPVARWTALAGASDILAHPAICNGRLYLRGPDALYCFRFGVDEG